MRSALGRSSGSCLPYTLAVQRVRFLLMSTSKASIPTMSLTFRRLLPLYPIPTHLAMFAANLVPSSDGWLFSSEPYIKVGRSWPIAIFLFASEGSLVNLLTALNMEEVLPVLNLLCRLRFRFTPRYMSFVQSVDLSHFNLYFPTGSPELCPWSYSPHPDGIYIIDVFLVSFAASFRKDRQMGS